jgi:hypothetical protein
MENDRNIDVKNKKQIEKTNKACFQQFSRLQNKD